MRRTILRLLSSVRRDAPSRARSRDPLAPPVARRQVCRRRHPLFEARYAARRGFGGAGQVKEHQRDARTFRWLAGWPTNLKLGGRMLVKYSGLTIVGGVAMAVAIWAGLARYVRFILGATPAR